MSARGNTAASASESEPNVAVIRGFYEAVDVPAMLEFLDPQVEWRAPESLPWGGTFRGHDGRQDRRPRGDLRHCDRAARNETSADGLAATRVG
jgi:ketosteroid isomerase-like protein